MAAALRWQDSAASLRVLLAGALLGTVVYAAILAVVFAGESRRLLLWILRRILRRA